jgi:NAD/NADP transhydrogenase beta subunit
MKIGALREGFAGGVACVCDTGFGGAFAQAGARGSDCDIVLAMDEINDDFPATDVVIVSGSNAIVNPAVQDGPNRPIAGMPVLEDWRAKHLFFKENTLMFFGGAKDSINKLLPMIE